MFRKSAHRPSILRHGLLACAGLLSLLVAQASSAGGPNDDCSYHRPLAENGVLQIDAGEKNASKTFSIRLSSAGILAFDLQAGGAAAAPELAFLGRGCHGPASAGGAVAVERTARRQVLVIPEPGTYVFEVPAAGADEVVLATSFLAAAAVHREHVVGAGSEDGGAVTVRQTDLYELHPPKNEEEEVDPDPNKSRSLRGPMLTLFTAALGPPAKNEEEEVDPDPNKGLQRPAASARLVLFGPQLAGGGDKNEEEEVDPDPNKSSHPGVSAKNEEEEVDPDPNKSRRFVDGLLTVHGLNGPRTPRLQAWVRFLATSPASWSPQDGLLAWLADVLRAEAAASRLMQPGSGQPGWRLAAYALDPID